MSSNRIDHLKGDEVKTKLVHFFSDLLGTASNSLRGIHLPTVTQGKRLSHDQVSFLAQDISSDEIEATLKGISVDKAPGLDGLDDKFFKHSWPLMKSEVTQAIQHFFLDLHMYPPINYTSVTLLPKIVGSCLVHQFRPIACCNMLYKIISGVLTIRLQQVIGEVISPE